MLSTATTIPSNDIPSGVVHDITESKPEDNNIPPSRSLPYIIEFSDDLCTIVIGVEGNTIEWAEYLSTFFAGPIIRRTGKDTYQDVSEDITVVCITDETVITFVLEPNNARGDKKSRRKMFQHFYSRFIDCRTAMREERRFDFDQGLITNEITKIVINSLYYDGKFVRKDIAWWSQDRDAPTYDPAKDITFRYISPAVISNQLATTADQQLAAY